MPCTGTGNTLRHMLRGCDPGLVLGSGRNPTVEVLEPVTGYCRGITLVTWLPGDLNSQEEMPCPPQTCTQLVHPSLGSHSQGPPSSCSSSSLYSWSRHVQLQSLLQVTKTTSSGPPVQVTFSIIVQYLFFVSILSSPLPLPLALCPLPHTVP